MMITSAQIKVIHKSISRINISTLYDDLLDHLCCAVEDKMGSGLNFERALHEAMEELAPEGIDEIQLETLILLNSKINNMKKFMYTIGLITTIGMTMGLTFKVLHMPGSEELFNFGFFGFVLIFLPMITIERFKQNMHRSLYEKLRLAFGFLSAVVVTSSMLFKIFHYDGASLLWLVGLSIFSFGFLPFLFLGMYKRSIAN